MTDNDEIAATPEYHFSDERAKQRLAKRCRLMGITLDQLLATWAYGVRRSIDDDSPKDLRRGLHLMAESEALFHAVAIDTARRLNGYRPLYS